MMTKENETCTQYPLAPDMNCGSPVKLALVPE